MHGFYWPAFKHKSVGLLEDVNIASDTFCFCLLTCNIHCYGLAINPFCFDGGIVQIEIGAKKSFTSLSLPNSVLLISLALAKTSSP